MMMDDEDSLVMNEEDVAPPRSPHNDINERPNQRQPVQDHEEMFKLR